MQSWRLLRHSISMVFNNFSTALRISVPLILAMIISLILFGPDVFLGPEEYDVSGNYVDPQVAFESGVSSLLQVIAALWVAVAWHRFILLEERPTSILPAFHGGRVLAYFGYGILIAFILIVVGGVVGGMGAFMITTGGIGAFLGFVLALAATIAVVYISARVYVVLPSAAIGQSLGLAKAWDATRGYAGAIILAYVLFVLIAIVVGFAIGLIAAFAGIVGVLLLIALNLVLIMVGMSFLTTIYGVTVEGRELS